MDGQESVKTLEYRFQDGEKGFYEFVYENINYPETSKKNGSYGCSISRISITPTGEIDGIEIINSIDEYIDTEVTNLLMATARKWIRCDSVVKNQIYYLKIDFIFSGIQLSPLSPKSKLYSLLFLDTIVVTTMATSEGIKKIYDDPTLVEASISLIKQGEYSQALKLINELIKRNPFNKELYNIRMSINSSLGRIEFVNQDKDKLANFIEGHSLDEIMSIN